jgi:hypothetical protein
VAAALDDSPEVFDDKPFDISTAKHEVLVADTTPDPVDHSPALLLR